jgi:hypothetical protein
VNDQHEARPPAADPPSDDTVAGGVEDCAEDLPAGADDAGPAPADGYRPL